MAWEDVAQWVGYTFLVLAIIIGLFILIKVFQQVKVVEEKTVMIIERFGKFHKRIDAGLNFLVPFIDNPRRIIWREWEEFYHPYNNSPEIRCREYRADRIDLRESIMNFQPNSVITRDNVEIVVNPMLLYKITDPVRLCYEAYDPVNAIERLIQTTLRSIIGDMGLDDTLASREEINHGLSSKLHNICLNWGIFIIKVELLEITPTDSIQQAMHKQIGAERIRRAAIISADGYREQVRTLAEGDCQSLIALSKGEQMVMVLDAKGRADAKLQIAMAEGQALTIVSAALEGTGVIPCEYIIGVKYIESLIAIATRATKRIVYFPFETEIYGALNALR